MLSNWVYIVINEISNKETSEMWSATKLVFWRTHKLRVPLYYSGDATITDNVKESVRKASVKIVYLMIWLV